MRFVFAAALAAISLAACGGDDTSGTTATGGTGGSGPQHPAFPQVINVGGPVLEQPKVQPIVYDGDPHAAVVEDFLAELSASSFWADAAGEYGVGALTVLPTIKRTGAAPASLTRDEIVADLEANTTSGDTPWGEPDPSTIYLFLLPQGSIVDAGGPCCDAFDGFHEEASLDGTAVPYAVICSCPGYDGPGIDDAQQITVAISHELIEAATDPFVTTDPAYYQTDDAHAAWTMATGGEVADLCELDQASYLVPAGAKHMVQRVWSNAAARAGAWPCLPATSAQPFFAAIPTLPDQITIPGWPTAVDGGLVGKGQSRTFDVKLWAGGALAGPIQVQAYDAAEFFGASPVLDLKLDKDTGQDGDTLRLTVTVNAIDATYGFDMFVLEAKSGSDSSLSIGGVNTH